MGDAGRFQGFVLKKFLERVVLRGKILEILVSREGAKARRFRAKRHSAKTVFLLRAFAASREISFSLETLLNHGLHG